MLENVYQVTEHQCQVINGVDKGIICFYPDCQLRGFLCLRQKSKVNEVLLLFTRVTTCFLWPYFRFGEMQVVFLANG